MKLTNVASFFDRLPCKDAYTGKVVFKGQFDLFNEAVRDGLGAMRRVLSVAPSVRIPPRKSIDTSDGKVWIVGESHPDYFDDGPIRVKYVLHQADGLATLQTFAEVLGNSGYRTLYAARVWVRVGVAAVAVLVLWANRPLNVFLIVFTVVNAALVLLLATLLWRTEPVPER